MANIRAGWPTILAAGLLLACGHVPAWADAAADCGKSGNWPVMISGCTAVIAKTPRAGWAYTNRCHAYERSGQFDRALADGHKAVELSPNDPLAFVNRGAAYIGMQNYNSALEDINKALRLDPRNANAIINRAYIHEQRNERDAAIADYRRTLELDSSKQYAKDALKRLGVEP
jgi:tetratricopeptide (TPR) repeat protein